MTDDLREEDVFDAEFYETVVRYLDDQLSQEELPAFEARLAADPDARQILLDVCLQMAAITESPKECLLSLFEEHEEGAVSDEWPVARGQWSVASGPWPVARGPWPVASEENLPSPFGREARGEGGRPQNTDSESNSRTVTNLPPSVSIILDGSPLAPQSSPLYVTHPFLFSNIFALLFIGLGLLGAWFYQIDIPQPIAKNHRPDIAPGKTPATNRWESVGRVTEMADVRWADNQTATVNGANVPLGRKYALASGLMEITYDTGAKVILQGPVVYEVESRTGGFLSIGKLTARLEKQSAISGQRSAASAANQKSEILNHRSLASSPQPLAPNANPQSLIPNPSLSPLPSPLFTIKTPSAIVTDLGTEFGVEVSRDGTTTSHVFRGLVQVQKVSADGTAEGEACVLHENQSARVEKNKGDSENSQRVVVFTTPAKAAAFVRKISRVTSPQTVVKTLDLVDIVAGGDGFSGRRNAGIDLTNGNLLTKLPKPALSSDDYTKGDGKYHRVSALPMVDGVFIPDGTKGPVQTDSAGNVFEWFPSTSNVTDGGIWVGGMIHVDPPFQDIPATVGGIDYSSAGHAALYLHSNRGITFSLDAIRQANRGYQIKKFRTVVGNTEVLSERNVGSAMADFWVLVDGKARYRRRQINAMSGDFPIAIPIGEKDRFLTLASTDGGDGLMWDWILFGDPRLELLSIEPDAESLSPAVKKR